MELAWLKNVAKTRFPLTYKEREEYRAKGLCFFCHERYTRDHKCVQKQDLQLLLMEQNGEKKEECVDEVMTDGWDGKEEHHAKGVG